MNNLANNTNLWSEEFQREELGLYESLKEKDIQTILDYQEKLPVLLENNETRVDARCLHKQLGVGRDYTTWIKGRIKKYDFEEEIDFKVFTKSGENSLGGRPSTEYLLTLEMAKQLAMIENNEIGRLARKYFIVIEKAFKERIKWNKTRQRSIDTYFDLKEIITKDTEGKNILGEYIPEWWSIHTYNGRKNALAYELYNLDLIIINQSAASYRKKNGLTKDDPIRNTFSQDQLDDFKMLQNKSAEYIAVNGIWNTDERIVMLKKFYEYNKEKKSR